MKRKVMFTLFALSVLGLSVSASAEEEITIKLYEQESQNSPKAEALLNEFLESLKDEGINVEHFTLGGDEPRTKVKAEFAAGEEPDIFYWNCGSNFAELIDADCLVEVNDFFANSETLSYDMWTDGSWANVSLDGETHWGFPITTQYTALVANKALFEEYGLEYPKTYEELLAVAEVFKEHGIFTLGAGSQIGNPSHFIFDTTLHQFAPEDYTIGFFDGSSPFDCPETILAGHYIQDMQEKGVMTSDPVAYGDWTMHVEMFNTGKAAMTTVHPWIANQISTDIDYEVIDWWTFPETVHDPNTYYIGGTNAAICIAKSRYEESDRRREAIHKIVEFYLSDEMVEAFCEGGIVAPRTSYNFDVKEKVDPLTGAIMDHLEGQNGIFYCWGNMPNSATAESYTLEFVDPLWACTDTPENLAANMQEIINDAVG